MSSPRYRAAIATLLWWTLLAALTGGVGAAVESLSRSGAVGLGQAVARRLAAAGMESPVNAVLMNFRGYDTFLETAVLLAGTVGVRALGAASGGRVAAPGPVQRVMTQLLIPFLILFAAFLVWSGGHAAGGAFPAGAIAAAAGVLLVLHGGALPPATPRWLPRVLIVLGVAVFAAVGAGAMVGGGEFLEYRGKAASASILLIEAAVTVSIGAMLLALFQGGRSSRGEGPER